MLSQTFRQFLLQPDESLVDPVPAPPPRSPRTTADTSSPTRQRQVRTESPFFFCDANAREIFFDFARQLRQSPIRLNSHPENPRRLRRRKKSVTPKRNFTCLCRHQAQRSRNLRSHA